MKTINIIIPVLFMFVLSKPSFASHVAVENSIAITDSTKKETIDPVCKMKIKPNSSKNVVYNKTTYYFCSDGCKQKFIVKPTSYIKK
ncbi:YHS domain-containing protein [Pedobacter sandarakinus]|uniref:YHS domain-containing protein n=1 Tax=Pedobacter sandarakinus TaxID=353156 RepID=UPI002247DA55|nr:YHS domain-containing protein [Pedobacter sandarakinus]MCX2574370.1 YHS domain-containing protein [Pedobacter sandarakinus]